MKQQEQQQPCTDPGATLHEISRFGQTDEKKGIQTGGKHGYSSGGCGTGSSFSEASIVPETGTSGWHRFNSLTVGGNDKKRGVFKAAKVFGGLARKFYRASWTPHEGGMDSRFDWVMEFPAGSEHDIV